MNPPGVLLDTGPLVALLSRNDANHQRAERLFADHAPPFRSTEAVVAEACFLVRKVHPAAPAEVVALGRKGVFEIAFALNEQWLSVERLLHKYANLPVSLADASLIRCAEIHNEPRILTFDADFHVYRWDRTKRFTVL